MALVMLACVHVTLSDSDPAPATNHDAGPHDAGAPCVLDPSACTAPAFEAGFEASYGESGPPVVYDSSFPDTSTLCPGCIQVAYASNPVSIALDATHVYWAQGTGDPWYDGPPSGTTGLILQAARGDDAGSPVTVVNDLAGPFILKQANGWLGWSNFDGLGPGMSSIEVLGIGKPAVVGPSLYNAHGVALDATNVYWVSSDMGAVEVVVQSAPLAGGAVMTLGTTTTGAGLIPFGLAVNATSIYFVAYRPASDIGALYVLPLTGGAPTALWTASAPPSKPTDVVLDGANVYWIDYGSGGPDGALYSMPLAGGTVTTMEAGLYGALTLALDSKNVYVAGGGAVHEAPIGATGSLVLATADQIVAVAADDTDEFVYFTGSTNIQKHAK